MSPVKVQRPEKFFRDGGGMPPRGRADLSHSRLPGGLFYFSTWPKVLRVQVHAQRRVRHVSWPIHATFRAKSTGYCRVEMPREFVLSDLLATRDPRVRGHILAASLRDPSPPSMETALHRSNPGRVQTPKCPVVLAYGCAANRQGQEPQCFHEDAALARQEGSIPPRPCPGQKVHPILRQAERPLARVARKGAGL